ncbi:ATP-binding protein, partial [Stenotrophomonas maltophilia]
LAVSDSMSDEEVGMLIFAPGFSTAEQVTDVSGRGVGMDVVKRNIQEMGGHVEIRSQAGKGTTIRILLPLTLAILDGMSVKVNDEV